MANPQTTTPTAAGVDPVWLPLYEEIADCPRCVLARTRTQTVPGMGPSKTDLMFIGEAPGAREDEQGLPFVGPSGRFLDDLLAGIGLSRDSVYIANVVKCRPPGNRDPEPSEIEACAPFLDRQIATVDPRVIVTLGRFSMARWFPGAAISRVHGKPKREGHRIIVPMYHPAAALHQGSLRAVIEADFATLPALIAEARGTEPAGAETTPSASTSSTASLL
jgi:uracil-DNA glycosylase family 4